MPRLVDTEAWSNATVKSLLAHAKTVVDAEVASSTLFRSDTNTAPRFDPSEVKVGRVVGRGGFCVVSEIRDIQLAGRSRSRSQTRTLATQTSVTSTSSSSHGVLGGLWRRKNTPDAQSPSLDVSNRSSSNDAAADHSDKAFLARQVWSKSSGGGKFVLKRVNPDLILQGEKGTFLKGIIDIALEAKFLSSLLHANIIELRGESDHSPVESTEYFIILDYLPETLPSRLNVWMHAQRTTQGLTGFMTNLSGAGKARKVSRLLTERLLVAYDIAAAGDYLHSRRVIFRDFKPDNVGFSAHGGITKLMDFGLAREWTNVPRDSQNDELYLLTGLTGSIRYMAPEVGLGLPYNYKADIYSWSMILWFILALEPPLSLYTPEMIMYRVFEKGHRPATKVKWSPALAALLRSCWSADIAERPSFKEIMVELQEIVRREDSHAAALMVNDEDARNATALQHSISAP
jgi:serine/threonine protein kinase